MKTRTAPRLSTSTTFPTQVMPPGPSLPARQINWYWYLAAAMVGTVVLYLPSVQNGITNWDDPDYLTNNPLLDFRKTPLSAYFTAVISGNLHPLTMLSLSLDYALGGSSPSQFHRTNLLLHVLNVGLVFGLIWQLADGRPLVAFLVALWFGIHPMHVESVAWLSERKDVLYGFFFLLSLITFWQFLASRRKLYLCLSLLCGVLASLSKPAAAILPVVLALLSYWYTKQLKINQLIPIIPFFLLAGYVAYLTLQAQASALAINNDYSLWERTQLGGYALVNYVLKLVWPVGLSALYGRPVAGSSFPIIYLICTVISLAGVLGLVWLYRRSALWFFGLMFFVVNLALTLHLIKAVGSAAYADRYTYIAYIGLFFATAMTIDRLLRQRERTWTWATLVATSLFSLAFGWLTVQRTAVWKNAETLWTDVLKTQPASAIAYSNRALFYEQNNRLDEALADYDIAVRTDPKPLFRANRAYLLSKLNRPAEAETDADFLLSQNPENVVALAIKGTALVGKNQPVEAIAYLKHAYQLDSTYLNTLVNLGAAYFSNQQYPEAARFYQKAIVRAPGNAQFITNLGATYLQNKQYQEATATCEKAIAQDPTNGPAHVYACYALVKSGHLAEARKHAQQAQALGQVVDAAIMRVL
ncbi:tetratricopeptide repeat protein [Fibrella forsythiae]|uniref:Tetratricopeptide repeat protein n=1 Tax=Fibrella forsythiae TaxID=2817061 RepID=A0ABS3JGP3_9BACT|nr:tetratricopeptide repeat protein [Fibrella forsythiae]MBO0948062.1 tetratricopeptide repeat protein [Fibrella forsythiae]